MSDKPDGGPAYPRSYPTGGHNGQSLRDDFAKFALQCLLNHSCNGCEYTTKNLNQHWQETIAEKAFQLADAMLAERAKR